MGNNLCNNLFNNEHKFELRHDNGLPSESNLDTNKAPESSEFDLGYFKQKGKEVEKIQGVWKKRKQKQEILERIRVIDRNLADLGKHIPISEMKLSISPNIMSIKKTLKDFEGTHIERESLESKLCQRPPFKYNFDHSIYHGQWNIEGLREGYGVYVPSNSALMEGLWRDGKLFKGRIFHEDGSFFEGDIIDHLPNGKGFMKFVNGNLFDGNWKDGLQIGQGTRTFYDKSQYTGGLSDSQIHGKGRFTWADGSFIEGVFCRNMIKGLFSYRTKDETYNGGFDGNLPNGQGTYVYSNAMKYSGEFSNGKKNGNGKLFISNDEYYDGTWVNNLPHGRGQYNVKNKQYKGLWRFGYLYLPDQNSEKGYIKVSPPKENFKLNNDLIHFSIEQIEPRNNVIYLKQSQNYETLMKDLQPR